MSLFKCKICGGALEIDSSQSIATCEYCGTKQTLPKLDNDKRASLYDRANHFRRNNEFDKAMAIYEQILNEDSSDSEAYWSIVLCRYGVEYVEDFALRRRVPTINRTQFTSIFDDEDYKSAIKFADASARLVYESEANAINEIQKNILAISQNEEPFDVFICYKETDASGRRTHDSVLATELYHELTREGFKVFFSRITLEDKLGVAYEPYIFAALHSSKVMVVIGTRREYFESVWVKNEWSRYLALIKNGAKKTIIPAYRDMDPYDLPEEFSHLQAQDMSKLGFMQDLTRGIKKIASANAPKDKPKTIQVEKEQAPSLANSKTDALIKRIFLFIEEDDIDKAAEYCEKVLDIDPENAQAYLAKLLIDEGISSISELEELEDSFEDNINYQRALRYGDEKLKRTLENCVEQREINRKERLYSCAKKLFQIAQKESEYLDAAEAFDEIPDYKDSEALANECRQKAETARLEAIYANAKTARFYASTEEDYKKAAALFASIGRYKDSAELTHECLDKADEARKDGIIERAKYCMRRGNIQGYQEAIKIFSEIQGYKDADEQSAICEKRIAELKELKELVRIEAEKRAKRNKRIAKITFPIVAAFIAFIIILDTVIIPNNKYNEALELMNKEQYAEAISVFEELGTYKDSEDKAKELKYNEAVKLMNEGKYTEAISAFTALNGYKDSNAKITESLDVKYNEAVELMNEEKYNQALSAFRELDGYKDSKDKINKIISDLLTEANNISAGGNHTVGLRADGTVVAAGYNYYGQRKVSNWSNIIAVSAGGYHTVGLRADGTVVAVGNNVYGQCKVSNWSNIIAVSAGSYHTVGLKADGTVVAVGDNDYGQCKVSNWSNIIAVSAGGYHTVGLKADGTVVAVGRNSNGLCNVSNWSDIIAVSAGSSHTVGLKADGTVVAVGDNYYGQCNVSNWLDIIAVSAGSYHTVGLKADGTVVAVGDNYYGPCKVSNWSDIIAVSAGSYHTVGLKADGTVVAVGDNDYGQCNVSNWTNIKTN